MNIRFFGRRRTHQGRKRPSLRGAEPLSVPARLRHLAACVPRARGCTPWQGAHNNHTERAERGVVLGRKNHYGSRSRRGTEVAALFYSFVESAKLNGLEPKAYLRLAVMAALRGERIPLPHEVAAQP